MINKNTFFIDSFFNRIIGQPGLQEQTGKIVPNMINSQNKEIQQSRVGAHSRAVSQQNRTAPQQSRAAPQQSRAAPQQSKAVSQSRESNDRKVSMQSRISVRGKSSSQNTIHTLGTPQLTAHNPRPRANTSTLSKPGTNSNLGGSKSIVSGSISNISDSKSKLTGSKINLSGSKSNIKSNITASKSTLPDSKSILPGSKRTPSTPKTGLSPLRKQSEPRKIEEKNTKPYNFR